MKPGNERLLRDKKITRTTDLVQLQTRIKKSLKPGETLHRPGQAASTDDPPLTSIPVEHPAKSPFARRSQELDGKLKIGLTKDNRLTTTSEKP